MPPLPTTLICTVGTSLYFPNLRRLDPENQYQTEPRKADALGHADKRALSRHELWEDRKGLAEILRNIRKFDTEGNHSQLAGQLVRLPPELRLCGAEINSVEAMIRKGFLSENRERLILLVSDTEDGKSIGDILSAYFTHRKCKEVGFSQCECLTVSGLQDEKPLIFQREGLVNLVRHLGEQLRKWGNLTTAINATGGYKAQIALAVAFGQAVHCHVFYKHERFDQIIRFPRIPFTIDLSMVENHLKLWANLADPGAIFDRDETDLLLPKNPEYREAIHPMLDQMEDEGKSYFFLSALGMVYWEAFLSLHPDITLEPSRTRDRRGCNFRDDNFPIGFKDHVRRVYEAFPQKISECHSLDYSGQKGIRKNRFYLRNKQITGEYVDKNNFGARFTVMTAAQNILEKKWMICRLEEWLAR